MPSSLAPTADGGLPPLELSRPAAGSGAARGSSSTALPALPSSRFRPRVLESTPADDDLRPIDAPPIDASGGRGPRRLGEPLRLQEIDERDLKELDGLHRPDDAIEKEKLRDLPSSLPSRRPGLFGGRIANPFAPRGGMNDTGSVIRAEPRTDPAADAALKRRVERQARDAVGDRVKSLDVRVVGRSITVQARGVKFLQRRAVRRSLESLPGLSGYRSVVEVVD